MLIQSEDADTDYELKEGSCWITIGTLSVYIIKTETIPESISIP